MKILNIMQCTNLGGMEHASLRLMEALIEKGHECEVISLNSLGELQPLLAKAGINSVGLTYRGLGGWRSARDLRREIGLRHPDALIMTGHNLMAMLALGSVCLGRRILCLHYHHAGVKPEWQWRLIYRVACARFSALTFPSDFVRKEAEQVYAPVRRIAHTVRNPLPVQPRPSSQERRAARRQLELPIEGPIIGNAGWLISRKRFDVFLHVAAEISRKYPAAQFVIAGDGPERTSLEDLATRLQIRDRVTFLGWLIDMEPFYRAIDVMLFNSDFDALPTTPLEAMAHGRMVVASVPHGGLKEVMADLAPDMFLEDHDVPRLSETVARCLDSPHSLGPAAQKKLSALFDPAKIASRIEDLLQYRTRSEIPKDA